MSGPAIAQATIAESFTLDAARPLVVRCRGSLFISRRLGWRRRRDQTVSGPSGTTVDHAFDAAGDIVVLVIATDGHGASRLEVDGRHHGDRATGLPGLGVRTFVPGSQSFRGAVA